MIIDNRLQTAKLKIFYMVMLGSLFAFTVFYVFEESKAMIYPMIPVVGIYLFFVLRKSNYFFLEPTINKITVRFYTAHPFFRQYKAIEIPVSYFFDYKLKSSLGGYFQNVQLIVKTPKGIFNYPPLSIVLLTKKQKMNLITVLEDLKHKP